MSEAEENGAANRLYLRCGIAVLVVLAAFILRKAMGHLLGTAFPAFITFYPAVMLVALLAGLWPGLLATTLSALLVDYCIFPPVGQFAVARTSDAVALAFFFGIGVFMSLVAERFRRNQRQIAAYKSQQALQQSEEKLRASEKQFETLANAIPHLSWIANADGWIFWYNQRWYQYTGTTPEDMKGWGWQSVHDPDVLPKVLEEWNSSIATGEPFDMVFPLRGADGVFRPFLTRVMPVKDAQGNVVRWFGTNTDISAQKQVEAELRKSKERLDLAVEVADLGEWDLDLETHTASRSLRHEQIFGYQSLAPEWTYEKFLDHVLPQHRAEVDQKFKASSGTGSCEFETQIRRLDGEIRWIWARGRCLRNETGQAVRMYGTVMDITGRKQAEQKLRESETRYKLLTESIDEPFVAFDRDLRVTYWNTHTAAMTGVSAEAALGKTRSELLGETPDVKMLDDLCRQSLRTNQPMRCETKRMWRGQERFFEVRCFPTESGVTCISTDFTERKRAEEALQRQADMLRLSFNAIIVWRIGGEIESWNQGAEQLYGYCEQEALGRVTHQLLKTTHPVSFQKIEATLREYGNWEGELHHIAKDGHEVVVSARHQLIIAPDGSELILETNRDITERKRAEDALQASEERLRLFIEHAPAALAMFDRHMRYLSVSRRWLSDYSLEGRNLHGVSHYEVFPELSAEWKAAHRRGLQGEVLRRDADRFERPDGSVQWIRWEIHPWYERGEVGGIVIFAEDITVRKKIEEQIRELNQQLEERVRRRTAELEASNKELEAFSYSVSHDLRGPLRTMDGFSQALIEDHSVGLNEKGMHYVNRIRAAARKMGRLIDDLLQLSRLSRAEMQIRQLDLSEIALEVIDELRAAEPNRSVDVQIEPGLQVKGDPGLLQIAMYNLLTNAWKFTSRQERA